MACDPAAGSPRTQERQPVIGNFWLDLLLGRQHLARLHHLAVIEPDRGVVRRDIQMQRCAARAAARQIRPRREQEVAIVAAAVLPLDVLLVVEGERVPA